MKKRPILLCGGHQAGSSVLPFCGRDGLRHMIRHAHYHYYLEVVQGGRSYEQYAIEFIKGHEFHDDPDAQNKNQHACNHGIVEHLLRNHKDIVKEVFDNEYEQDYLSIQAQIFPQEEEREFKRPPSSPVEHSPVMPSFNHKVSLEMLQVIVAYANDLRLFKNVIDMESIMDFLDGNSDSRFTSNNNRAVAYFFHTLSQRGIICDEWQNVIGKRGLIRSARGDRYLTGNDLSTALSNVQYASRKPDYALRIEEMEGRLKELAKPV